MKFKTEHYVLLAGLLIVSYFLFFKKEEDGRSTDNVGYDPNADNTSPIDENTSSINVSDVSAGQADNRTPLARVAVLPAKILTNGGNGVGKNKWSRDRRAVISACRNNGGTFVEGTGDNAGYYGCF